MDSGTGLSENSSDFFYLSFEKSDLKTQIGAWPDKSALATLKSVAKDACVRGVVCESEAHIIMPVFLSFEFSKDRFENSIVFFALWHLGALQVVPIPR